MKHADGGQFLRVDVGLIETVEDDQPIGAGQVELSGEVQRALAANARRLFEQMYGDEPDRWSPQLAGMERLRFTINVLTRLRVCTADGRVDLALKGEPPPPPSPLRPWFTIAERKSREARVVFGHWSALGLVQSHGVLGLDSGCVWGGALTAFDLDAGRAPISVPCAGYQRPDD